MNKNKIVLISFICVGMIHLLIVVYQIAQYEIILRTGEQYKIRIAPVDPYDAFRGRYLTLSYQGTSAPIKKGDKLKSGSRAYVSLSKDNNGFAIFTELSSKPPMDKDYLRVIAKYDKSFILPYNRFYMEETISIPAERLYFEHSRQSNQNNTNNCALIRVKNGKGVIEDLYINGMPVKHLVKLEQSKQK